MFVWDVKLLIKSLEFFCYFFIGDFILKEKSIFCLIVILVVFFNYCFEFVNLGEE